MTGAPKHDRDGRLLAGPEAAAPGRFHALFVHFRDQLDEHHDRRERIVKASRDVTALSKKIIFALQRVKKVQQELPQQIQQEMGAHLAKIEKLLLSIAPDIQSLNRHRYAFPLRGLEELVEAISFAHYLRHQRLITPAEAQAALPAGVVLTAHDYLYGIFDLFGELMRFATVQRAEVLAPAGGPSGDRTILSDMQQLSCAFEVLPPVPGKDFEGKKEAMRQSVAKVEKLGYGLVVRVSERPARWLDESKDESKRPVSPV